MVSTYATCDSKQAKLTLLESYLEASPKMLKSGPSPLPTQTSSPQPCAPHPALSQGVSVPTRIPVERQGGQGWLSPHFFPFQTVRLPPFLPRCTYTFPDSCSISSHWVCSNSDSAASKMVPCQEEKTQVCLRGATPGATTQPLQACSMLSPMSPSH